ncbi:MAG: LCP family protein [Aeromicrobium sp.]
MSDPRSNDQYDWLYGKPQQPDAPTAQQASAPRGGGSDLPPPNLPPPGRRRPSGGDRPPRRSGSRRSSWRTIKLVLLVWIVFLAAVPVWAWSRIDRVDAEPAGERPGDQPGITYLLVGSDSRKGLTAEQRADLSTGNPEGARTDTILLLHIGAGPSTLVSVPRDSIVPIRDVGTTKINAAYAVGGPKLLVETLEQTTGVRIDDYVEIGFGGLVNLVDSVGGIEICPKEDVKDKDSGLDVKKGCQEADGKTALAYSRNRHSFTTQDIERVQNQREVIGATGAALRSPWTVINPARYFSVGKGGSESLTIGENVGPISLARFALSLSSVMGGKGLNCTVPLADFSVRWDRERALQFFELIKTDRTAQLDDLCTKDGLPKS